MGLFQKKKAINLVIQDYIIRMAEIDDRAIGNSIKIKERPIPFGLIKEGQIIDDLGFYEFMKLLVAEWEIKKRDVRFYVPESSVLMRPVTFPSMLKGAEITEYFRMEIGQSIHFPFEDPIIDIVKISSAETRTERNEPATLQGILFATPEEEVRRYTEIFEDVQLKPVTADIRTLGNYRLLQSLKIIKQKGTYMLCDWTINSLTLSIFSDDVIDFMRYQQIETSLERWEYFLDNTGYIQYQLSGDTWNYEEQIDDKINELDRIINFYRFSLHKGEKEIDELLLMGDNPYLSEIASKVKNSYSVPVRLIGSEESAPHYPNLDSRHVSLAGVSLKEAKL
ncbi:type IV pilus biogenesis protein PilM [Jeotgalibacillus soli]|uniref:Tfp pilus assembly protein, ATPase PilM n=1 Tax=Jeotgalibacillus soli TaxID=889306 RepID=A0A0C2RS45_9BACL|nr:pilus assembly protein PilM [Jeotgalibacillus soli]KIL44564.1 hypothetical protein KP78_35280 [Jeotgalibacillus soli]